MMRHGLTPGMTIHRIPDGTKYLVIGGPEDGTTDLLHILQGSAVQIVINNGWPTVYVWPKANEETT